MTLYYQGSFRLPAIFAYGAGTVGVMGDSLLISTMDQQVAKVSIPKPSLATDWRQWPGAQFIPLPPTDITQGVAGHNDMLLGGVVADGEHVYWNAYQYYNVDGAGKAYWGNQTEHVPAHFNQSGYLAIIPKALRKDFGGYLVAGKTNAPGGGNREFGSEGPSAFVAGRELLGYTLKNPAAYGAHVWKGANSVGGVGFMPKLLVFIVRVGTHRGDPYGIPIGADARCGNDKGFYAPPYRVQAWSYRVSDMLAVKHGVKKPYELVPASRQDLTRYFVTGDCAFLAGAGFDASTQTFYIAESNADTSNDAESLPVMHVFKGEIP